MTTQTKRGRGRPLGENNATTTLPPIRIKPEQKERYKLAADKEGLSLSAWIKKLADENS